MGDKFNGRRVRAWCIDSGITMEDLADGLGVKLGTLKSWVYGTRSIDFASACAIATYFNKPLDELRDQALAS